MSISSDGILCFGFPLSNGEMSDEELRILPWRRHSSEDDETWWIDEIVKLPEPESRDYRDAAWDAWREARRGAIIQMPVTEVMHCSIDYPMYILAIGGTRFSASRGYPEMIPQEALLVSAERIEAARKFCEQYNIPWQEPQWILCSLYG